jgi:hypothetical protein
MITVLAAAWLLQSMCTANSRVAYLRITGRSVAIPVFPVDEMSSTRSTALPGVAPDGTFTGP